MDFEETLASIVLKSDYLPIVEEATQQILVSLGLQKPHSQLNIVCSSSLVKAEFVMREMEYARANTSITKLELEHLITRDTERDLVCQGLQRLLWDAEDRVWEHIKFVDSIHVVASSIDAHQLRHYESQKEDLCCLIQENEKCNARSLQDEQWPLTFQLNLHINAGFLLDDFLAWLRLLLTSRAAWIEFGGALSDHDPFFIPHELADLFSCEDGPCANSKDLCLREKIVLKLVYLPTYQNSHTKNYKKVLLSQCLKQLSRRKLPEARFQVSDTRRRYGVDCIEWLRPAARTQLVGGCDHTTQNSSSHTKFTKISHNFLLTGTSRKSRRESLLDEWERPSTSEEKTTALGAPKRSFLCHADSFNPEKGSPSSCHFRGRELRKQSSRTKYVQNYFDLEPGIFCAAA